MIAFLNRINNRIQVIKQMLARSRYLLYKSDHKWTVEQKERASLLFERYTDIQKAYKLCQELSLI